MPMSNDSNQNLLPWGATISKNSPHISDWPLDHDNFLIFAQAYRLWVLIRTALIRPIEVALTRNTTYVLKQTLGKI